MAHLTGPFSFGTGPRSGRARATRALVAGLALTLSTAPLSGAPPSLEEAVKASYIFKFAPFIEWPSSAFASGAPFTICMTGQDPFGAVMDDVVRGQKIRGRPILLRRLASAAPVTGCHIVFMGRPAPGIAAGALPAGPILTISDAGNGAPGGMIQFVMQGSRVRFQIDDATARANGIVVSSKLLNLSLAAGKK